MEGDANLTEYLFYESLPFQQQALLAVALERKIEVFSGSEEVAGAPRILTETFAWEHSAGPGFVFRVYLRGGFEAVNLAYGDPPRSTEQILHPEKYLVREDPDPVELPDLEPALGGSWREVDTGVFGELLTQAHLATYLSRGLATEVAAGWGGDRYALLKDDGGGTLIAIRFSWDTVEDADEFWKAYLVFVDRKSRGEWELARKDENLRLWVGEGISVFLSREGGGTLVVIGPDLDTVETVVDQIS